MPTTHHLKTLPAYWEAVARGDKPFDVRKDDRAFQTGDTVVLELYNPGGPVDPFPFAPSASIARLITFVLHGGQFGIEAGHVVLGLGPAAVDNGNNGDK